MKITFLGTGTSHGVPVIGCQCPVCLSEDPKDKRWRSSILVEDRDSTIVVDTGYEFRLQMLRAGVRKLDGVLYTHTHSDHLMGLDDLRVFCKDRPMNIYSFDDILNHIRDIFPYAFPSEMREGLPNLEPIAIEPYKKFKIKDIEVMAIPVKHGCRRIAGYRFGKAAYLTDVSDILLADNKEYLMDLDVLIIGALRENPHPTHYSFSQALEASNTLNAKKIYFTHICHSTSHQDIMERYKQYAEPAYDGLVLEVDND